MSKRILLLLLAVVLALLHNAALADIDRQKSLQDEPAFEYSNDGTDYDVIIQKKSTPQDLQPDAAASILSQEKAMSTEAPTSKKVDQNPKQILGASPGTSQFNNQATHEDANEQDYYSAFNLDGILDLMAGDDEGNVNFGAIGLELANNLANVIDMNEVGSMAATLGMMLSGLGAVNELQRQGNSGDDDRQNSAAVAAAAANIVLNNGLAALLGQEMRGIDNNAGRAGTAPDTPDTAQLYKMLAGVAGAGTDANQLSKIVNDIMNPDTQSTEKDAGKSSKDTDANTRTHHGIHDSKPGSLANTIGSVISNGNARNIADAVADFVGGNDTSNITSIAQAVGIRNFFRTEEKKVPEGCPSCFNCMYPGSVCAHNATCNQFTGRCDCPSGWTGEDCLEPGK
ncbi:FAD-dependent urate hydroxylase [Coemansia guatemalensis]|uniref:FAD-dependent urate hydroxylase n=1 Tax=Coemansia guatemalensis TaxID=2761395 RepID=A0A9W8HY84_9FUNG|nr:FAD-dependent urate hydroxylase [Coemansia guatemalensis]